MKRAQKWLVGVASAVVVCALVLLGVSFVQGQRGIHAGFLWQHTLSADSEVTDQFAVAGGGIYEFGRTSRDTQMLTTVSLVDPTTGATQREWSHPAVRNPYLTRDGGVLYQRDTPRPDSNRTTTELTLYSATDTAVWRTHIQHRSDEDLYVTAADDRNVAIAVCGGDRERKAPAKSALTWFISTSRCRLSTIDESGTVSALRTVDYVWDARLGGPRWADLPGHVLPRVTIVPGKGLTEVDVLSPTSPAPVVTLPYTDTDHFEDVALTPERMITVRHRSTGCVAHGYGLTPDVGAKGTWSSRFPCGKYDVVRVVTTTDETGAVYVGIAGHSSSKLAAYSIAPKNGSMRSIPEDDLTQPRNASTLSIRHDLAESVAGDYVVNANARDGDSAVVTGSRDGHRALQVTGEVDLPATAQGSTVALRTHAAAGDCDLPWLVSINPFIRDDDVEMVTVYDARTAQPVASACTSSQIVYARALTDGTVVVATADGHLAVVGRA